MNSDQIRSTFLTFFGQHDHRLIPGGTLMPEDDSILFTNAGMVPFKPYFLGRQTPVHPRLMSSQQCVRTVDIDNIGRTTRHATSFEMLGSFGFGDYWRGEIMAWAWELLTEVYRLDPDRLWVTVFHTDDETVKLWRGLGVRSERIQRLGIEDNFWSMGVPGPAGPDTEIFFDRGSGYGPDGGPAVDSERFLELWNLVFMQYLRGGSDEEIVGDLPGKYVDTGLGLDRLALVLQNVDSVHDTDLAQPMRDRVREWTGRSDEPSAHRIITDHLRTSMLLVEHGVTPSNSGRGYVLRRLLRRAIYQLRSLGVRDAVLGGLNPVAGREEQLFSRTLRTGERLLNAALRDGSLSPQTMFRLHDTHGFPVDLTVEIAQSRGVMVDRHGFDALMREHRERSRAGYVGTHE